MSHPTRRILLIDDSPNDAQLMRRAIDKEIGSAQFTWIEDAVEGLRTLSEFEQREEDLIFLDIKMPKMTGLEILEKLENEGRLAQLRQINVLSSSTLADDRRRATAYDQVAYYTKPEGYRELRQLLRQLLPTEG